ncbi:prolactin-inducible protein [Pteronotus mesoamericanus]|uniref:prolactin-inducible protein n=1 Tax=Pteronotus mesoamericanus TaxID=1884717 RepID=UPI0023EDB35A|nr:prolactin-inducible protein [Pteronotus parnellii mesoamericanus]
MQSLQLLLRASHVALLLVLCLQLGTNTAQEDTNIRQPILMDLQVPQVTRANEEITAKLTIQTELRECMVVKTYLASSKPIEGPFNYKYTGCLCNDYPRTFYWDFQINSTLTMAAVVDIIPQLGICPNDEAVIPIKANRFSLLRNLFVF